MNALLLTAAALLQAAHTHACASHNPAPAIPQTFIGTVGQGCTPTVITQVSDLVTDPTKCLLLFGPGCNLCNLRLYKPETTTSRFLVQPLMDDTSTEEPTHVEATECRCADGCYFHRSSITQLGIEPLPKGTDGTVGSFSEPFACFSGSFMPTLASAPTYTFLIWCENDGGCPNNLVARYSFLIRFELSSPNRPPTKSAFTATVASLPQIRCLKDAIEKDVRRFLNGRDRKKDDSNGGNAPPGSGGGRFSCGTAKSISRCVNRCMEATY